MKLKSLSIFFLLIGVSLLIFLGVPKGLYALTPSQTCEPYPWTVHIDRITPRQGQIGTKFTLSGQGFSTNPAINFVRVRKDSAQLGTLLPTELNKVSRNGRKLTFILNTEEDLRPQTVYEVYVSIPVCMPGSIPTYAQSNSVQFMFKIPHKTPFTFTP